MEREQASTADHTGTGLFQDQIYERSGSSNEVAAAPSGTGAGNVRAMPKPKRIILLLDGTWNDAEFGTHDTNIVRLREIISRSLALRRTPLRSGAGAGPEEAGKASVGHTQPDADGINHLVYYLRGVGTGAGLDRFKGGGLGRGLDRNVRRAYKFLSFHYAPGDEVFVFGFSRGAYTARSLVGFIASAGLLKREHCTPEQEELAWSYYRTPPDDRSPGIWHALGPYMHERDHEPDKFRIDCLGVFDTVGALGVPLTLLRRLNRQLYEFHNVELPSITKKNLHAIAIDEHRHPFQAAVWRQHKFKRLSPKMTEQVWFTGDHADIGGGHLDIEARKDPNATALDDIALDWMLKRVTYHFSAFPFEPSAWKVIGAAVVRAPQHDLRRGGYRILPRNHRSIANQKVARLDRSKFGRSEVNEGYERHEMPADEMVHISALERLGHCVECQGRISPYAPPALTGVLTTIESTYREGGEGMQPECRILVVDWTGEPLDPADREHRGRMRALVQSARQRLGV